MEDIAKSFMAQIVESQQTMLEALVEAEEKHQVIEKRI